MNEFDALINLIEGELLPSRDDVDYISGTYADGRKFARIFRYDEDGEAGEYFEVSEAMSGENALDTNYVYSRTMCLRDTEHFEVFDIIDDWAAGDDGIYLECSPSGFIYGGVDYSTRDGADYSSRWYWTDDVREVRDCRDEFSDDEIDELYLTAGRKIVEDNGAEAYGIDEDDEYALSEMASQEAADIINLWRIPTDSRTYGYLLEWYDHIGKDMDSNIRSCFYEKGCLFFVTGTGYAIFSSDLLGGNASGIARKEFEDFIEHR